MIEYPVSIPRTQYHGTKLRELQKAEQRNSAAARIEDYINKQHVEEGTHRFLNSAIARDLVIDLETVREITSGLGGSNGLTIRTAAE